jgi:hypothetical protein
MSCLPSSSLSNPSSQVLYANRFHVYSTLIMLSYPFFSIGAAAILLAFGMEAPPADVPVNCYSGMLTAVWCAEDPGVQAAAPLLLILPISMAVLFGFSCATAAAKSRLRKDALSSLEK